MGMAPHEIRQAIERQLLAVLGAQPVPWQVSRYTYDAFPGADTDQIEALAFAVGLPNSEFHGRQSGTNPIPSQTAFGVRFSSRLRADNQQGDYDQALQREQALIRALRTMDDGQVTLQTASREVVGAGTVYLGHVQGFVVHTYPLS